jgi:predicted neuraminidase
MATIRTQRLFRSGISSKRAQPTITAVEAYFGTTIGGNTGDNTSSQKTSSKRKLGNDNEGSVDKAN